MSKCRICDHEYTPFIDFGNMPIANGFLTEDEFDKEYFFRMEVGFCPVCAMVQLIEQPAPEMMFHENYAYFSSISVAMANHFEKFANLVMDTHLTSDDPFVVELGSNDGIMLRHFAEKGIRHLGVEPSANVAEAARKLGINTICEFFGKDLGESILKEYGQADAILAANVMCHIPSMHSVIAGFEKLLSKKGVVMYEDPYLGDIIEKTSYDQIYDEHVFYFSVASVNYMFGEHGMEVFDVMPQTTHGGSMRYVIGRKGEHDITPAVKAQVEKEEALGLRKTETYGTFRKNVEKNRDDLMDALNSLKAEGKRVVGYGATSKSTTVTTYCGITPEHVEFVSDTTPGKQNKCTPGAHIPVKPYAEFKKEYPDVALLFAWNHGKEIMANETDFHEKGGKWLVYVPEVKIL